MFTFADLQKEYKSLSPTYTTFSEDSIDVEIYLGGATVKILTITANPDETDEDKIQVNKWYHIDNTSFLIRSDEEEFRRKIFTLNDLLAYRVLSDPDTTQVFLHKNVVVIKQYCDQMIAKVSNIYDNYKKNLKLLHELGFEDDQTSYSDVFNGPTVMNFVINEAWEAKLTLPYFVCWTDGTGTIKTYYTLNMYKDDSYVYKSNNTFSTIEDLEKVLTTD